MSMIHLLEAVGLFVSAVVAAGGALGGVAAALVRLEPARVRSGR